MSSDIPSMSGRPGSEELPIAIPQSSGRPSRPPSIEGLEFSPLPPAVEDEPQQLFTPVEPSNALFELGTAEPPTWSLDDDGVDATPALPGTTMEAENRDDEAGEGKPNQADQRQTISTTDSTPASIPSTLSYEPTPTLKPQESFSPPSSLSTHTSTSSFSTSSTNLNPTENQQRKRRKRKMDTRLQPHNQTSLEEEEK